VAPTEAGARLLARLSPALGDIQAALDEVNDFRDSPLGRLRINAPRPACEQVLAPLVCRFLARHPGMQVELVADDALVDIVAAGFDAGVRFGERLQQDMVALPIGPAQRFVVVASPAYLAAHGAPRTPHELPGHACVRLRFPSGAIYRWDFARDGEALEVEVNGPITVGEMPLAIHAAEAGLGLAYVYASYAAAGLAAGRLRTVLDDWRPADEHFYLYYPSRKLLPAGLRAFVDMLREAEW